MCYRPMATGMERIKTLTSLRLPTVELPDDFDELQLDKQVCSFDCTFARCNQEK